MSNSKEGYRCQICGKIIPMQDRLSHESICRNKGNQIPIKNINYTKSFEELNNLNNSKNFASIFNFDINAKSNTKEKNDSINNENINKTNNNINININNTRTINTIQNEDLLNNDIIFQARNIESNYNNQDFINDNGYYNDNTLYHNDDNLTLVNVLINNHNNKAVDKTIIDKLNTYEIKDKNKMDTLKCAICLEDYQDGDRYISLPCLHNFHSKCILKWMNVGNRCPKCNFELTINNINKSKIE
jgi:hypothetical protein